MSGAFQLADLTKRVATLEASLAAAIREIELLKVKANQTQSNFSAYINRMQNGGAP